MKMFYPVLCYIQFLCYWQLFCKSLKKKLPQYCWNHQESKHMWLAELWKFPNTFSMPSFPSCPVAACDSQYARTSYGIEIPQQAGTFSPVNLSGRKRPTLSLISEGNNFPNCGEWYKYPPWWEWIKTHPQILRNQEQYYFYTLSCSILRLPSLLNSDHKEWKVWIHYFLITV